MDVFAEKLRTKISKITAMVLLLLAVGFSSGCNGRNPGVSPVKAPPLLSMRTISVDELAHRLGLKVTRSSSNLVRMVNEANSVMIFAAPGCEVYVNGRKVDSRSVIETREQTFFVPERLETRIRQVLRSPSSRSQMKANLSPSPLTGFIGTVVLDAGHGGRDPGAIGSSGDCEKYVALAVTQLLAEELRANGVRVELTRDRDVFVTLDGRVVFANRTDPSLFVSIHADSSPRRAARGFTVFVPRRSPRNSRSHRAGRRIAAEMLGTTSHTRGVRVHEKNLRVLEQTTCSAVLIELGFLSCPQEAVLLNQQSYQERLATAISKGIAAYLKAE